MNVPKNAILLPKLFTGITIEHFKIKFNIPFLETLKQLYSAEIQLQLRETKGQLRIRLQHSYTCTYLQK